MTEIIPIPIGQMNCYLLRQGSRHILVDAASPGSERKLVRRVEALGLTPEALDLLILTHYHADHSGGAEYLREHHGVRIAMHPKDAVKARPLLPDGIQGQLLLTASKATIGAQLVVTPDYPLEAGLGLHGHGIEAEIVDLPGHTAGSIGILFEDGRLICGDAMMNFTGPRLCLIAENFPQARATLDRLLEMNITTVYPGHGRPFEMSQIKTT